MFIFNDSKNNSGHLVVTKKINFIVDKVYKLVYKLYTLNLILTF